MGWSVGMERAFEQRCICVVLRLMSCRSRGVNDGRLPHSAASIRGPHECRRMGFFLFSIPSPCYPVLSGMQEMVAEHFLSVAACVRGAAWMIQTLIECHVNVWKTAFILQNIFLVHFPAVLMFATGFLWQWCCRLSIAAVLLSDWLRACGGRGMCVMEGRSMSSKCVINENVLMKMMFSVCWWRWRVRRCRSVFLSQVKVALTRSLANGLHSSVISGLQIHLVSDIISFSSCWSQSCAEERPRVSLSSESHDSLPVSVFEFSFSV